VRASSLKKITFGSNVHGRIVGINCRWVYTTIPSHKRPVPETSPYFGEYSPSVIQSDDALNAGIFGNNVAEEIPCGEKR
jgi:hypothetical protein